MCPFVYPLYMLSGLPPEGMWAQNTELLCTKRVLFENVSPPEGTWAQNTELLCTRKKEFVENGSPLEGTHAQNSIRNQNTFVTV